MEVCFGYFHKISLIYTHSYYFKACYFLVDNNGMSTFSFLAVTTWEEFKDFEGNLN